MCGAAERVQQDLLLLTAGGLRFGHAEGKLRLLPFPTPACTPVARRQLPAQHLDLWLGFDFFLLDIQECAMFFTMPPKWVCGANGLLALALPHCGPLDHPKEAFLINFNTRQWACDVACEPPVEDKLMEDCRSFSSSLGANPELPRGSHQCRNLLLTQRQEPSEHVFITSQRRREARQHHPKQGKYTTTPQPEGRR